MAQRRAYQLARARPRVVELLAGLAQFLLLTVEDRKPLAALPVGRFIGPRVAVNGLLEPRLRPQAFGKPALRRRPPQAPFPFRPVCAVLGGPTAGIELQPVEHAAPPLPGRLWTLLRSLLAQLVAVLRGRPVGLRARRQFQALEPAAALLPIVAPV